jgi:hypothetical protein
MDEDCEFYKLPDKVVPCGPISAFLLHEKEEGFFDKNPRIACTTFVQSMSDDTLASIEEIYSHEDDPLYEEAFTDLFHTIMILLAIKSGEMESYSISVDEVCSWSGIFLVGTLMEQLRRDGKVTPESMDVPLDEMRNSGE